VASDESALSQVTANMSLEGYVLTGQSEHQYQLNTVSVDERFQNLNETEREKLAADGVETESAAGQTTFRYRVDITYLVFTHQTTGSCQVVPVIRLLDAQGNPIEDPGHVRGVIVHANDLIAGSYSPGPSDPVFWSLLVKGILLILLYLVCIAIIILIMFFAFIFLTSPV
jgi:hypothetical protein